MLGLPSEQQPVQYFPQLGLMNNYPKIYLTLEDASYLRDRLIEDARLNGIWSLVGVDVIVEVRNNPAIGVRSANL